MAHLVRQKKTYHVNAAGRRVPAGTRGAKKVTEASAKWYGAGVPGMGKKRVPLATDKRVAQKMLQDLVTAAERGEAGLSGKAEASAALEPLVVEFGTVVGRKAKPRHVAEVLKNVRRVLAGCRLSALGHLRAADLADRVERFVWGLTEEVPAVAPPTAAYVGKHARQFTRWLWRKKKLLAADPLAGMDLPSQEVVTKRRSLSAEELAKLIAAAAASERRHEKMPPAERVAIYSLAVTTGFRVTELASLTPADFHPDADPPVVRLAGKFTKNGRDAELPLAPTVVALLRPILAARPHGPLWPGKWQDRAARMFRKDLAAAGVPETTAAGRADFHSLRHTFVTLVGASSPLKVLQELARHSTPILTVGRYSHAELSEKAAAVASIPLTGDTVEVLTRPQLEAVAAVLLVLAATLLVTPPVTPNVDTGENGARPPETGGAGKAKRRGGSKR